MPPPHQGALFPTRFFRFRVNLTGIFSSVTKRPFLTELFSSVCSLPGLFGNKIPERHVATSYQNLIRLLQVALSERSKHFCFGFVVLVHGWLVGQRSVLFKICGSSSCKRTTILQNGTIFRIPPRPVRNGAPEANSSLFVNHSKVQFRNHLTGVL